MNDPISSAPGNIFNLAASTMGPTPRIVIPPGALGAAEGMSQGAMLNSMIVQREEFSLELRRALLEILPGVEPRISASLVGQEKAVHQLLGAFWEIATGLDLSEERPATAFVLYGPNGVGKSLLPRVMVDELNTALSAVRQKAGIPEPRSSFQLLEIDCSKLHLPQAGLSSPELGMDRSFLNLLVNPQAVVVFRNYDPGIEALKATLPMILEKGMLCGPGGIPLFFNQSVVVLELSSGPLPKTPVGMGVPAIREYDDETVAKLLPENLLRWVNTVKFSPLTEEHARQAVNNHLAASCRKALEVGLRMEVGIAPDLMDQVIRGGFNEKSGLLNLRREMEKLVLQPLWDHVRGHPEQSEFALTVTPAGAVVSGS